MKLELLILTAYLHWEKVKVPLRITVAEKGQDQ
jgi:hypothetical protein